MNEYVGNAMPAPGYSRKGWTNDQELLMATNPGSYHQKGVTLKSGQGVLLLGTLIKQEPATKLYVKATDNTAEGVLRTTVDTGTDPGGQKWQGNILFGGLLNLALMQAANSGVTLSSVLGARITQNRNLFKF